jgi:hypothetical protein
MSEHPGTPGAPGHSWVSPQSWNWSRRTISLSVGFREGSCALPLGAQQLIPLSFLPSRLPAPTTRLFMRLFLPRWLLATLMATGLISRRKVVRRRPAHFVGCTPCSHVSTKKALGTRARSNPFMASILARIPAGWPWRREHRGLRPSPLIAASPQPAPQAKPELEMPGRFTAIQR